MPPTQAHVDSVSPARKIRCVLVHDHILLRQGLKRLLEDEPDLEVVGEAGSAAEAARRVFTHRPDVVIADAATFGLPAREAEALLISQAPDTKVLFLSTQEPGSPRSVDSNAGLASCAVRQTSSEELVKMVQSTCQNRMGVVRGSSGANPGPRRSSDTLFPQKRPLTAREREVLKLLAEGRTVRAAASILGVSIKTVDAHKFNLMRKLGLHNKAELVMWAIQKRVVKIPANF